MKKQLCIVLVLFIFIFPVVLFPGSIHFGLPSAVKDKVEEIKEKRETDQLPSLTTPSILGVSSVSGNVNIAVEATNTVKVEFYVDGVLKATDTAEPYEFTLGTAQYSEGVHTIEARAYNAENQTASTQTTITVTNNVSGDNPPAVTLTSPVDGSTVSGTVIVNADASDDKDVGKVEFYVDRVLKSTVTAFPYSYSWDSTQYVKGTHTIKVIAYDTVNQIAEAQCYVTVDNNVPVDNPPTVTFSIPTLSGTIGWDLPVQGTLAVDVYAVDDKGIAKVEFYIDDILKDTDTLFPYNYSWDTTQYNNGTHTLKVIGYDTANQSANSQNTYKVDNVFKGTGWSIETIGPTGAGDMHSSIALDSSNKPHISYCDSTNKVLKYAKWTGINWSIETVDSTGDVGWYPAIHSSIAIDSNNNPHIAYNNGTDKDLKYAKWTGTNWAIETVDSIGDVGTYASMVLDSSNNPHISYHDATNGDLKYAKWTGTVWSVATVDSAGGSYNSIALDRNNNPHIAYSESFYSYNKNPIKYANWSGTSWNIETVDTQVTLSMPVGTLSIAIDSNDNPHIAYHKSDYPIGKLMYAKRANTTWNIEILKEQKWAIYRPSLALDSNNNPHIVFARLYGNKTGSGWNFEGFDAANNYPSGDPSVSLALDSNNNPHISYGTHFFDDTNRDLKYATKESD